MAMISRFPARLRNIALVGAAVTLSQVTLFSGGAQALTVDKMIFFSTDVSGSIDSGEYDIQRLGWANAFLNSSIKSSIVAAPNGIAVAVGQWDTVARSPLSIDWTHLTDAASVDAFSAQFAAMLRQGSGTTCISCGLNAAVNSIQTAVSSGLFDSGSKIIDISGDGVDNQSSDAQVQAARDLAASLGIGVNGLAIEGDFGPTGVSDYYQANVITPGGFVETVTGFGDFETAATIKLGREVSDVPGPLPLLGLAMALAWARRLRQRLTWSMG